MQTLRMLVSLPARASPGAIEPGRTPDDTGRERRPKPTALHALALVHSLRTDWERVWRSSPNTG